MNIPRTRATTTKINWDIGSAAWGALLSSSSSSSSPLSPSSAAPSSCCRCFSSANLIELCSDIVAGVSALSLDRGGSGCSGGPPRWLFFWSPRSWLVSVVVVVVVVGGGGGGCGDDDMMCNLVKELKRKKPPQKKTTLGQGGEVCVFLSICMLVACSGGRGKGGGKGRVYLNDFVPQENK